MVFFTRRSGRLLCNCRPDLFDGFRARNHGEAGKGKCTDRHNQVTDCHIKIMTPDDQLQGNANQPDHHDICPDQADVIKRLYRPQSQSHQLIFINTRAFTGSIPVIFVPRYPGQFASRLVNLSSPATMGTIPKVSRQSVLYLFQGSHNIFFVSFRSDYLEKVTNSFCRFFVTFTAIFHLIPTDGGTN